LKRLFCIIFLFGALNTSVCIAQSDIVPAVDTSVVYSKLNEYLSALDQVDMLEACSETDLIISSVVDSVMRNEVATRVYRHFRDSKYMGAENVAIYVYDRWFAPFKTLFADPDEFDEASLYAFVNRASLLGCKAPELTLEDLDGKECTLPSGKRPAVLFFYSVGCPKCLYISQRLKMILSGRKLDFYAVYVGEDDSEWAQYVKTELSVKSSCKTRVHHLKSGDSPFSIKYGVIATPRLFLIAGDGVIVGRNLDAAALQTLLELLKP